RVAAKPTSFMTSPLDEVCCARFPQAALAALANLRCAPGVQVVLEGDQVWLRWEPGQQETLREVLPLPGVELYVRRDNQWFRFGQRLPAAGPLTNAPAQPLDRLLLPAPVEPEAAPESEGSPVALSLVRDDRPRPATAIQSSLAVLNQWAD